MVIKEGEQIQVRFSEQSDRQSATVISMNHNTNILEIRTGSDCHAQKGQLLVISNADYDYYTEIAGGEGTILQLKGIWADKRGYFRVNDVLPIVIKKVRDDFSNLKSKVLSGLNLAGPHHMPPDETIHPRLWEILVDINTKLDALLERSYLEYEVLTKARERQINISASGMRLTVSEKFNDGDVVEVRILLERCPPVGILVYGKAVRTYSLSDGGYDIAVRFLDMNEEVKEELIKYTLNRQREIISMQRARQE